MKHHLIKEGKYNYIETGEGTAIIILRPHGWFK